MVIRYENIPQHYLIGNCAESQLTKLDNLDTSLLNKNFDTIGDQKCRWIWKNVFSDSLFKNLLNFMIYTTVWIFENVNSKFLNMIIIYNY